MPSVVRIEGARPLARDDGQTWRRARMQEAAVPGGPWTQIEDIDLATGPGVTPVGLDVSAATPQARNLTSDGATLTTGYYRIVWVDQAGATDTSSAIYSSSGSSGYPTVSELVGDSTVDALTGAALALQESYYASALNEIEGYCGQAFTFEPGATKVVRGSGIRELYLPVRLETLTAIVVANSALTLSDVNLRADGAMIYVDNDASIGNYYTRVMRELDGSNHMLFTEGEGAVTLSGDWGWGSFPAPVRDALRIDMEDQALADGHQQSEMVRAYRAMGVDQVGRSGGSRSAVGFVVGSKREVNPRLARLLEPYLWLGAGGRMA